MQTDTLWKLNKQNSGKILKKKRFIFIYLYVFVCMHVQVPTKDRKMASGPRGMEKCMVVISQMWFWELHLDLLPDQQVLPPAEPSLQSHQNKNYYIQIFVKQLEGFIYIYNKNNLRSC